jgi:hypothetical protein
MPNMLKKLTVAVICLCSSGSAMAAKYGVAGCGLGSLVFHDQSGPIQIIAATLNGTGFQTIGITLGTSNCEDGANALKASADQEAFTRINYANLSRDAAAGQGEYLTAFATLLGCEDAVKTQLFSALQQHHRSVFAPEASSSEVLQNARQLARVTPEVAEGCTRI